MTTPRIGNARVPEVVEAFAADLISLCQTEITVVLGKEDVTAHYAITVSLVDFNAKSPQLANAVLQSPVRMLPLLDEAINVAQRHIMDTSDIAQHLSLKPYTHVRLSCEGYEATKGGSSGWCSVMMALIPELSMTKIPRSADVGRFISMKGTVIRTGMVKMLETQRLFECTKCSHRFVVNYDREQYNMIPKPNVCPGRLDDDNELGEPCPSNKFKEIPTDAGRLIFQDYQEIKLQEHVNKLAVGTIPRSMLVILEDDLVDQCKAGDDVTIRCDLDVVLIANHVRVHNQQHTAALVTEELVKEFNDFWEKYKDRPLEGRNIVLKSFCPKLYGLYVVKLAVVLILIGGVPKYDRSGVKVRGDAHMLLVGDPGTGKSQFLKYAARVSPRSVLTTGIGSTNAGLTVTAVKDSGEWQLEAGALVLADRGLCCIDEFGSIRESDKTAIHEAMEQQTLSVAKAGLVCKLNTRCSILAATNPKGKYDVGQNVSVNVALASPLLSRFDLILVLLDSQNDEWDKVVSSFILKTEIADGQKQSRHQRRRDNRGGRTETNASAANEGGDLNQSEHPDRENDVSGGSDARSGPVMGAQAVTGLWPMDRLQAYIAHVKATCQPQLSEGANEVLKRYYQVQRASDVRNAARTTVFAVMLMEASMQTSALVGVQSTLHSPFPENPEKNYEDLEKGILGKLGLEHLVAEKNACELTEDVDDLRDNGGDSSPVGGLRRVDVSPSPESNRPYGRLTPEEDEEDIPLVVTRPRQRTRTETGGSIGSVASDQRTDDNRSAHGPATRNDRGEGGRMESKDKDKVFASLRTMIRPSQESRGKSLEALKRNDSGGTSDEEVYLCSWEPTPPRKRRSSGNQEQARESDVEEVAKEQPRSEESEVQMCDNSRDNQGREKALSGAVRSNSSSSSGSNAPKRPFSKLFSQRQVVRSATQNNLAPSQLEPGAQQADVRRNLDDRVVNNNAKTDLLADLDLGDDDEIARRVLEPDAPLGTGRSLENFLASAPSIAECPMLGPSPAAPIEKENQPSKPSVSNVRPFAGLKKRSLSSFRYGSQSSAPGSSQFSQPSQPLQQSQSQPSQPQPQPQQSATDITLDDDEFHFDLGLLDEVNGDINFGLAFDDQGNMGLDRRKKRFRM
ncbi:hypothetical protein HK102_012590 [Quaeritorhiza haematococci]|nr:hypothetical protein HK102_012590 [Quaeritorhiza haematococci]